MHEDILAQCDNLNTLGIITSPHNIVKLCLAFLILLANTILIAVILKSQKFRSQRFHMFIISLALADILVGLIIPFMVITAKENSWGLGVHFCQVFNRPICWALQTLLSLNQLGPAKLLCTSDSHLGKIWNGTWKP